MTQIPLPPSYPPPEPLDADERELARALRSLPAGSPSPELDARILGAARRAVHVARPRKRKNTWLIGLGTAASALLAVGLFVKMHGVDGTDGFPPPPDAISEQPAKTVMPHAELQAAKEQMPPATANAAAAPAAERLATEREAPADLEKSKAVLSDTAAADAGAARSEAARPQGIVRVPQTPPLAARQSPNAFPAAQPGLRNIAPPPPPPPVVRDTPTMSAPAPMPAAPASAPAQAPVVEEQDERKSDGFAAHENEPAAVGGSVAADKDESPARDLKKSAPRGQLSGEVAPATGSDRAKNLDRLDVAGSRSKPEDYTAASKPNEAGAFAKQATIDDDATLQAAHWIERIRERLKAGDKTSARASLRRFRQSYPDIEIPDDLKSLLP